MLFNSEMMADAVGDNHAPRRVMIPVSRVAHMPSTLNITRPASSSDNGACTVKVRLSEFRSIWSRNVFESVSTTISGVGSPAAMNSARKRRRTWLERDGMIQSGMEGGANESYDRLAELLATLTAK